MKCVVLLDIVLLTVKMIVNVATPLGVPQQADVVLANIDVPPHGQGLVVLMIKLVAAVVVFLLLKLVVMTRLMIRLLRVAVRPGLKALSMIRVRRIVVPVVPPVMSVLLPFPRVGRVVIGFLKVILAFMVVRMNVAVMNALARVKYVARRQIATIALLNCVAVHFVVPQVSLVVLMAYQENAVIAVRRVVLALEMETVAT